MACLVANLTKLRNALEVLKQERAEILVELEKDRPALVLLEQKWVTVDAAVKTLEVVIALLGG